jgi:hypothetical protein
MSQFITPLDTRKLGPGPQGRSTYKLLAPLVYRSDLLDAFITVPADFVTDFASVPRLPLMFMVTGDRAHEAAVLHDWLYTVHCHDGREVSRAEADAVFREAVAVSEESASLAALMYAGVRIGGGHAWDAPGRVQPEMVRRVIDAAQLEAS